VFSSLFFVCLFVINFAQKLLNGFASGWQWASEQLIKFWWRSGSLSGCRDRFPDSSLLADMEGGINQLRCATL